MTSKPLVRRTLATLERGVRLLRRRGVDARADTALLRRLLQRRHLLARLLYDAWTCDQLVDRRHVSLHPLVRAITETVSRNSFGTREQEKSPILLPYEGSYPRKAKSRQPPIAEQKALRRHRGPQVTADQRKADRIAPEVMHPINSEGTCPRKPRSSRHCLAISDSV